MSLRRKGASRALMYSGRNAVAAAFTPASLSGLLRWYDPSDSGTITIATGVAQMADKSGNADHFVQATGANQPAYETGGLNSLNTLLFDGVNDGMLTGSSNLANYSVMMVFQYVSLAAGNHDLFDRSANPFYEIYMATAGFRTYSGADNNHSFNMDTNAHQLSVVFASGLVSPYLDGTAKNTGSNGSTSSVNTSFGLGFYGGSGGPLNWSNVRVGEIVVVNGAIGDSDRIRTQDYLKAKWGTP